MLQPWLRKEIKRIAEDWAKHGFLGASTNWRDLGCPGCRRPVVLIDTGVWNNHVFVCECDNTVEAARLVEEIQKAMCRCYDRSIARIGAEKEAKACHGQA